MSGTPSENPWLASRSVSGEFVTLMQTDEGKEQFRHYRAEGPWKPVEQEKSE